MPSPRVAGQSSGPVIRQGTDIKVTYDAGVTTPPRHGTEQAWELYHKDRYAQEMNFLHPAKEAKIQSQKFDKRWNPDNPPTAKEIYNKQEEAHALAQAKIDYYKEQLRSQIEQRKFLAKKINPKSETVKDLVDVKLGWMKGNDKAKGFDVVAEEFERKFPGVLNKEQHPGEALSEYFQTLTMENQKALRSLIRDEMKTKAPKKFK